MNIKIWNSSCLKQKELWETDTRRWNMKSELKHERSKQMFVVVIYILLLTVILHYEVMSILCRHHLTYIVTDPGAVSVAVSHSETVGTSNHSKWWWIHDVVLNWDQSSQLRYTVSCVTCDFCVINLLKTGFQTTSAGYLCPPVFLSLPVCHSSSHTIISNHHQIRPFFFSCECSSITPLCLLADILSGPLTAYLPSTLWVYTLKSWLPLTAFF